MLHPTDMRLECLIEHLAEDTDFLRIFNVMLDDDFNSNSESLSTNSGVLNGSRMKQFTRNRCRGCRLFLETFMSVPSLTNICKKQSNTQPMESGSPWMS